MSRCTPPLRAPSTGAEFHPPEPYSPRMSVHDLRSALVTRAARRLRPITRDVKQTHQTNVFFGLTNRWKCLTYCYAMDYMGPPRLPDSWRGTVAFCTAQHMWQQVSVRGSTRSRFVSCSQRFGLPTRSRSAMRSEADASPPVAAYETRARTQNFAVLTRTNVCCLGRAAEPTPATGPAPGIAPAGIPALHECSLSCN
jgi:hypothetical protein